MTTERRRLARPPAGPAHPGALPRVLSRARGDLLGVHLPRAAHGRAGHRVPEPRAGARAGGARRAAEARTTGWRGARGGRGASRSACSDDSGGGAGAPHRRRRARGRFRGAGASSTATIRRGRMPGRPGCGWTRRCSAPRAGPTPWRSSEQTVREAGARYVDFVVPGLLGMNLMGSGIWGLGFAIVDARRKHLLKRLVATPMSRPQFLASFVLSRLTFLDPRGGAAARLRRHRVRRPVSGVTRVPGRPLPA